MRLLTIRALSVVVLSIIALPAYSAGDDCLSPRLSSRGGSHHIDIISYKPWVYVTLNNSRPLHFILDAGSPWTVLNTGLPETVGFTRGPDRTFEDGFVAHTYTPKACVRTLGVTLSDINIGDIELDYVSAMEGERIDGLIGGELFQKYVVRINYMESTVDVFPATYEYKGDGIVLPIAVEGGHSFADVTLTTPDGRSVKGTFLVDTGVRMALLINGPFADRNELLLAEKRVPRTSVGWGINGETKGDICRVHDVELGGFHLKDVMSVVSRDDVVLEQDDPLAGIIGADLLRRFRVTLDYPHKQMILEATPETYARFVYDKSGLFLLGEGDDYRDIRVKSIIAGSPAEDAGVRGGDRLVSIDGKNVRRLGLDAVRRLFRENNTRYRLVLERGGEMVTTQLVTKDLLETKAAVVEGSKGS